jgi:hypothetical protein
MEIPPIIPKDGAQSSAVPPKLPEVLPQILPPPLAMID